MKVKPSHLQFGSLKIHLSFLRKSIISHIEKSFQSSKFIESNKSLYLSQNSTLSTKSDWKQQQLLHEYGMPFTIQTWPTDETYNEITGSRLPAFAFFAGAFISIFAALYSRSSQSAKRNLAEIQKSEERFQIMSKVAKAKHAKMTPEERSAHAYKMIKAKQNVK